jgi:hypothetical protein
MLHLDFSCRYWFGGIGVPFYVVQFLPGILLDLGAFYLTSGVSEVPEKHFLDSTNSTVIFTL